MTQVSAVIGVMLLVVAGFDRSSHPTAKSNGLYERNTTSSAKQQGVLHFHATYTAPYCGGADPGDAGMPRTRPWQGAMYVRHAVPDSSGKFAVNDPREPIMDTLRTDGTGNGSVVLPIGNYLLLDQDRVADTRYMALLRDHSMPAMYTEPIDKDRLDRWFMGRSA